MRPSERGSGDMLSELEAYALDKRALAGEVGDIRVCACISSSSVTSLGGITELNPLFLF